MFINFKKIESSTWTVDGIGGIKLPVVGKGDIPITIRIKGKIKQSILNDVLYVPGIKVNLFSIKCATSRGYNVLFTGKQIIIKKGIEVKMIGSYGNGSKLYRLNFEANNQSSAQPATVSDSSLSIWHQRFSHVSYKTIKRMGTNDKVYGMTLNGKEESQSATCRGCALGKMARLPFPTSVRNTTHIGELVHTDVCGPMQVPSLSGCFFYVLFIDDFSGMRTVYFMKNKSDVFKNLQLLQCKMISKTGKSIRTFRSDGGGEFLSDKMRDWMTSKRIRHETSISSTPQQNGVSERGHRTICDALYLWAEAINYSVYTRNRTPSNKSIKTPYQIWNGEKPDVRHLRIFGSESFVHVPDAKRRKLDPKSIKCFLVGYCDTQKGYCFWDPIVRTIRKSRDAIINENTEECCNDTEPSTKSTV